MIQRNNNLSVLPFYTAIDEQNHRRSYAYGEIYPLYVPLGYVPTFQIVIDHTEATISAARLFTIDFASRYAVVPSCPVRFNFCLRS